ncbi:hypothetical protein [Pseudoxanthomonas sp.]|uniref:hypothetical protein n=1 Tax=Pseudoxanthomonas sp. TaxID=1871049 RepID=UPI002630D7FF|nr:hypothetical protein [Pseudoxanthomonas sp.]WDS34966.1 MAG: hypothetical protein O8I58_11315 [Pseudoxanthomonas sp.]
MWTGALLALAGSASAQQAGDPSQPVPALPVVRTLEEVRALPPDEEEVLDLYRFENPITVDSNRFDKAYDAGISPEEMALHHGGYINYGINRGLYETWKGFKQLTGMRPYEQPAIARPPPLTEDQMRRAAEQSALTQGVEAGH